MNTVNGKFQNQFVAIELLPLFDIYLGKTDFTRVSLYDAYQKPHYYANIFVFTNHDELNIDSICRKEIAIQTKSSLDSAFPIQTKK